MDLKIETQLTNNPTSSLHLNEDLRHLIMPWPVKMKKEVITTREKLEAFNIVKAILRDTVDINRVTYKDTLSYFVIQLDGTSQRTVCRLHFERKKSMVVLNEDKSQVRYKFKQVDELYKFAYLLRPIAEKLHALAIEKAAEALREKEAAAKRVLESVED